jgi:transposase
MNHRRKADDTTCWAGFDMAKLSLMAAIWGYQEHCDRTVRPFNRTRKAMKLLLGWLREMVPEGKRIGIVMEATGSFSEEVAEWLLDLDPTLRIAIVNPGQTSAFIRSLGFRNKTDDLDAKALAQYGQERQPVLWQRPSPEMKALRDLVRTRIDLVQARTAMKLRLGDHERTAKMASKALATVIESLTAQIAVLDLAIEKHVAAHESLSHQVERLCSIKGVKMVTATTILVELGDLRRFTSSRQLSAFAGLSPKLRQSGTSLNGKAHLCKMGSGRARAALYMAAGSAARFNPDLKATYQDLQAKGKTKRSALGAVMRKLLVLMRAVLVADHDWVPMRSAA